MSEMVNIPLDEAEEELVAQCSAALGVPVSEVDVTFAGGTVVKHVKLTDGSMLIQSQYADESIVSVSIPIEQGVQVRQIGYAAAFDRTSSSLRMGPTLMAWMLSHGAD